MKAAQVIVNKSGSKAEMLLYGYIGSDEVNSSLFAAELSALAASHTQIDIRINSVGGSVYEGLAMIEAIKRCPVAITGYIDGIAASMAASIALSLPKLYISKYGRLMTHRVRGGGEGNADDMRSMAENMQQVEDSIVAMLAEKTGLSAEAVRAKYITQQDRWLNADQALAEKLVNGIFEGKKVQVSPSAGVKPEELWSLYNAAISDSEPKKKIHFL